MGASPRRVGMAEVTDLVTGRLFIVKIKKIFAFDFVEKNKKEKEKKSNLLSTLQKIIDHSVHSNMKNRNVNKKLLNKINLRKPRNDYSLSMR